MADTNSGDVPLVITHGACRDGFCAAWVAWRYFQSKGTTPEVVFAFHQEPPPDVLGRDLYILDFSFKRPVMEQVLLDARSVTLLDHHKSALDDLSGIAHPGNVIVFDMERSGAMLAWNYFFGGQDPPWLVRYVQDRDLWRHRLSNTREVNAYINTLRFDFDLWEEHFSTEYPSERAIEYGRAIVSRIDQYVRNTARNAIRVEFEGHRVPFVNAAYMDISDVLDALRKDEPFAVGWSQGSDGLFKYSLRSSDDGVDVSVIAQKYGGGGHRNAAGFTSVTPIHLSMRWFPKKKKHG